MTMKKVILTLFICLSAIFYAACNVEPTDYFKNAFGEDTTDSMFFVELRQYNERNIMFIKDAKLYIRGKEFTKEEKELLNQWINVVDFQ